MNNENTVRPKSKLDLPGHFNRRSLLGASALLGAGGLAVAQQTGQPASPMTGKPALTVKAVYAKAREALYPLCRVCPECDGVACAGDFPGFGGVGSGAAFRNNFTALQRVRVNMKSIMDGPTIPKPDTSTTIFGQKLSFPALSATIGANVVTFGKGLSEEQYFDAIIGGCAGAGAGGGIGDNPANSEDVVRARCEIIKRYGGKTLYCLKPRSNDVILKLLPIIEAAGVFMIAIDTDSGPKTVAELREVARATRMPLVVKGIMTPEQALKAGEAGAKGIVVSNHGGRRIDHTPGTAEVLPVIADKVKGKLVILADGCVHYGIDVFKYVALGADAVLVGRHLVRAAFGGGREGVTLFMRTMRDELETVMTATGVASVADINRSNLS